MHPEDDETRPLDAARMIALVRRIRKLSESDSELASLLGDLAPSLTKSSAALEQSGPTRSTSHAIEAIFAAGQNAFENGDPASLCPYAEDDGSRSVWLAGWDEARRFAERTIVAAPRRDDVSPDGSGTHS